MSDASEHTRIGPLAHSVRRALRSLSVVVPVFDEAPNVRPLVQALVAALRPLGVPFELVIVDDGSRDGTLAELRRLCAETPELVVIALRRNFGQTLALQAGLDRARGDAVVTLDGDLQNDPRDIPRLLEALEGGADVVSGWRRRRRDAFWLRRLPSAAANLLARRVTGVPIHDQGCSLKAYRREVARALDLYGELHRFVALLTVPLGASIAEVEVRHHPRSAGRSKYGLSRTLRVFADLAVIRMLTAFRESPMRWFGRVGTPFLAASLVCAALAWLVSVPGGSVVFPAAAFLTAATFAACLLVGLLGELALAEEGAAAAPRVLCREWPAEQGP
jgi:glycosyltransferase involved in cell wall biosynthesis